MLNPWCCNDDPGDCGCIMPPSAGFGNAEFLRLPPCDESPCDTTSRAFSLFTSTSTAKSVPPENAALSYKHKTIWGKAMRKKFRDSPREI